MRQSKIYKGCELESPTYKQVAREMKKEKEEEWCHYSGMPSPKFYDNTYKTKRGKRS